MKKVERGEIVDYQTYEETRDEFRRKVLAEKARRRIHVGSNFTFLFENPLTMRYQVQEIMRAERIVKERDILHELETYNGILGGEGELGCTLLVEIDDPVERDACLRRWRDLPAGIYARLADGTIVRPAFDEAQRDAERISSVQYLRFPFGALPPVAIGIDLPGIATETALTGDQQVALAADLAG